MPSLSPYIQHHGYPAGFLHVLAPHTIAFVDFAGNKQYISIGNLSENPKAHLFLMDYANRQRVTIWGDVAGRRMCICRIKHTYSAPDCVRRIQMFGTSSLIASYCRDIALRIV